MKKLFLSLFFCLVSFFSTSTVYAQNNIPSEIMIEPKADKYQWIAKKENGKIYKRLWNASKQRWETDWILVS